MAPKDEKRAAALQSSYAETTAWLIAQHKAEFDDHRAVVLKKAGFEWSPPLTQEQKDEAALKEILGRTPHVLDHILQDRANAEATASAKPSVDPHS